MGWKDWKRFLAPKPPQDKDRLGFLKSDPAQPAPASQSRPQPGLARYAANPELTAAGADLGLRIHRQMAGAYPHENLVVSPISLQLLLAMATTGAGGSTQEELGRLLGVDKVAADWHWPALYADMMRALRQSAGTQELRLANSIWVSALCRLRSEFEKQCRDCFDAEVTSLDFHSADAIARINAWVSQETNRKISEVVNALNEVARMLLVNCVYFYGKWEEPFKSIFTKEETFHALSGDVQRPSMHQTRRFSYQETGEFQAVRLSYGYPSALVMSVFLPTARQGLEGFVNSLGCKALADFVGRFQRPPRRAGSAAIPYRVHPRHEECLTEAWNNQMLRAQRSRFQWDADRLNPALD